MHHPDSPSFPTRCNPSAPFLSPWPSPSSSCSPSVWSSLPAATARTTACWAMAEAVKVFSDYNPASTDPEALKRAVATVNGEVALLRPIYKAVSEMSEGSAAEVRDKEARTVAKELLTRHLGQLLPGGSVKIRDYL